MAELRVPGALLNGRTVTIDTAGKAYSAKVDDFRLAVDLTTGVETRLLLP